MTHLHDLIKWAESKKRFIIALKPERTKEREFEIGTYDALIVKLKQEIEKEERAENETE